MSHSTHSASTENILRIVANQRRRSILDHRITSERDTLSVDSLVEHVSPENPPPRSGVPSGPERIRLELRHNHLPTLEDAGLVEYDDRTEPIRYQPTERVEKLYRFVATELE